MDSEINLVDEKDEEIVIPDMVRKESKQSLEKDLQLLSDFANQETFRYEEFEKYKCLKTFFEIFGNHFIHFWCSYSEICFNINSKKKETKKQKTGIQQTLNDIMRFVISVDSRIPINNLNDELVTIAIKTVKDMIKEYPQHFEIIKRIVSRDQTLLMKWKTQMPTIYSLKLSKFSCSACYNIDSHLNYFIGHRHQYLLSQKHQGERIFIQLSGKAVFVYCSKGTLLHSNVIKNDNFNLFFLKKDIEKLINVFDYRAMLDCVIDDKQIVYIRDVYQIDEFYNNTPCYCFKDRYDTVIKPLLEKEFQNIKIVKQYNYEQFDQAWIQAKEEQWKEVLYVYGTTHSFLPKHMLYQELNIVGEYKILDLVVCEKQDDSKQLYVKYVSINYIYRIVWIPVDDECHINNVIDFENLSQTFKNIIDKQIKIQHNGVNLNQYGNLTMRDSKILEFISE